MPAGRAACRLSKCKIQVQGIDAAAKGSLPRGGNVMVVQGVREERGLSRRSPAIPKATVREGEC